MPVVEFDLEVELREAQRFSRPADRVIAMMDVYCRALALAGRVYAHEKTEHDRLVGRAVTARRANGERSREAAVDAAIAHDDRLFQSRLNYRLAEQEIVAHRAHLARLHAALDDLRTQAADARAGSTFHANDPGTP